MTRWGEIAIIFWLAPFVVAFVALLSRLTGNGLVLSLSPHLIEKTVLVHVQAVAS